MEFPYTGWVGVGMPGRWFLALLLFMYLLSMHTICTCASVAI